MARLCLVPGDQDEEGYCYQQAGYHQDDLPDLRPLNCSIGDRSRVNSDDSDEHAKGLQVRAQQEDHK